MQIEKLDKRPMGQSVHEVKEDRTLRGGREVGGRVQDYGGQNSFDGEGSAIEGASADDAVVDQVQNLGNTLLDSVLKDIEKGCSGKVSDQAKHGMADHFWCEILAQIADAIDEGLKLTDSMSVKKYGIITRFRQKEKRIPLEG